jgi:hypothetical protein
MLARITACLLAACVVVTALPIVILTTAMLGLGAAYGAEIVATPSPTVVDVAPAASYLLEALAGILATLVSYVGWMVSRWLKLKQDSEIRVYLERALMSGINFGKEKLAEHVGRNLRIDAKSELVAVATRYVVEAVPGALNRFGLDRAAVEKLIIARLPENEAFQASLTPAASKP